MAKRACSSLYHHNRLKKTIKKKHINTGKVTLYYQVKLIYRVKKRWAILAKFNVRQ